MSKIQRDITYGNKLVIVDGLWRTGKSLLTPIVGSFKGIDKVKFDYYFEWICVLCQIKSISIEDASVMLKVFIDLNTYNNSIGREINLRPSDDSGIFKNPRSLEYFSRIFKKDSNLHYQKLKRDKPTQFINTHNVFQIALPVINAFKNRLKFIRTVRNPVNNIIEWGNYLKLVGTEPREMNLVFENNIPWFVGQEFEDLYPKMNDVNKAAVMYISFKNLEKVNNLSFPKGTLYELKFEELIIESEKSIKNIEKFLNLNSSYLLKKQIRKLKLPRYRNYKNYLHDIDYENSKEQILRELTSDVKSRFSNYVDDYENELGY